LIQGTPSVGKAGMSAVDYVIRVLDSPLEVDAGQWNGLLAQQSQASPFMRHEYLAALHESGCASAPTGWTPRFITLWRRGGSKLSNSVASGEAMGDSLAAACALYLKDHSYGEYVFDWAWANAYAQHGLDYYPKAVVAVPFTPVPGARLLALDAPARQALAQALIAWCGEERLSSLHLLFGSEEDVAACASAGMMLRHTVQFHWKNMAPTLVAARTTRPPEGANSPRGSPSGNLAPTLGTDLSSLPPEGADLARGGLSENSTTVRAERLGYRDFDDFLASLAQDKRKKIRQERRKVSDAGVHFRWSLGTDISAQDWDFFYRCYERTYLEHGNAPYLNRDFFARMAQTMPGNWLLFVAERETDGMRQPIAASLIAVSEELEMAAGPVDGNSAPRATSRVAYGRYWGALERVDCLHFEACYYQPLQWCIDHGYQRFEGGAQGEHKMARALLPVKTTSAHWLAHPAFADAVERFLEREGAGVASYLDELSSRSPFRQGA
jgi:predicted N-acyltransferase